MEERRFENETEEKRFEKEMEEKRFENERKIEEKRFERELEAKLQSEKLAAQLELERLQLVRAWIERKNIKARAEVHLAVSSQVGQENVAAVTKIPGLPGFVDGKDNLANYVLRFEIYATIAGWQRDTWAVRLSPLLLVKHWIFILDYQAARMLEITTSCGRLCCRGMILPSKDIARGLGMQNQWGKNHLVR